MDVKSMFLLAVATSIDALMVGVTFAFLNVAIFPAVLFIGATTFVCSAVGVKIGSIFGMRYKSRAELCGGIILILIGLKIVLVQKFLNKWTIFLFCSILFSSNQKEH